MKPKAYWEMVWADPKWLKPGVQRSEQQSRAAAFLEVIPEDSSVVDVGCGDGGAIKLFKEHGRDVTGIDIAGSLTNQILALDASFIGTNLLDIQRIDGHLADVFFCCDMLQCLQPQEIDLGLAILKRLSKSGGMICVCLGARDWGGYEQNHTEWSFTQWAAKFEEHWGKEVQIVDASNYRATFIVGRGAPS